VVNCSCVGMRKGPSRGRLLPGFIENQLMSIQPRLRGSFLIETPISHPMFLFRRVAFVEGSFTDNEYASFICCLAVLALLAGLHKALVVI
jgi:hypothetical protein